MKITIPLISRNRPAGLLSVLTSMNALATGGHEITYVLVLDEDDQKTIPHVNRWYDEGLLPENAVLRIGKRDKTLNARMNEAANAYPADVYSFLPDDGFPLAQHWDAIFYELKELPAFAWCERNDPTNPTFICLSEKWREATGQAFPDYFPFWFADTWINEVHLLAFAKPIRVVQQLSMGGRRGTTQGMRDLKFWFEFFTKTRVERIEIAQKLAKAYGLTVNVNKDRRDELALFEQQDRVQLTRIDHYEKLFGANVGEPSVVYQIAKEKAEAWTWPRSSQQRYKWRLWL